MRRLGSVIGILMLFLVACEGDQMPVSVPDGVEGPSLESAVEPHPMNANPPARDGRSIQGATHSGPAIISNGVVQLGIHPEGHLNVPGGTPSSGTSSTTFVGLRYVPTNGEATAPGCLCEGWGVADASTGVFGNASEDTGGVDNVTVVSFDHTPTTAISVVDVAGTFRVTHDYRPSPQSTNLYEVIVTIENISGSAIGDLRYTRGMDWDIAPNTFSEFSTIQGAAAATNVILANNNGFNDVNPLAFRSDLGFSGDFVDAGPNDHGAHFDFGFGSLAPGETFSFRTFYGAAGTEAAANSALSSVRAEVYSYGQANCTDCSTWIPAPGSGHPTGTEGATTGRPHTFIFAFEGVGGRPPPDIDDGGGGGGGATCNGKTATRGVQKRTFFGTTFWIGTSRDDVIIGGNNRDVVFGLGGNDTICVNGASDEVNGGPGADWIDLGRGNDAAFAGAGNDTIFGGPGNDRVDCGHSSDPNEPDTSTDEFDGGPGHDHGLLCEIETNVEESGHDHPSA